MSIRLAKPFCAGVARVRAKLAGRDRDLFDFLCSAGQLGYRLPDGDINLKAASGAKDPRKRLASEFSRLRDEDNETRLPGGWAPVRNRLARMLVNELDARDLREEDRALRVLLAYAPIALAPDLVLPKDPLSRAAWDTAVRVFSDLFPSNVKPMGPLECVHRRLAILQREAASGLRVGRLASGRRPGREGRRLAVDPQLMTLVGKAIGKEVEPGYMARYIFYTKPGDHIWPHPDDPRFPVTVLICILHEAPPNGSPGSAFLAYPPNGAIRRYPIAPGSALAVEPGMIHAREPLRRGERVALLSIGLSLHSQREGARRRGESPVSISDAE